MIKEKLKKPWSAAKKWFKYNGLNLMPLLVFFIFAGLYGLAEGSMERCLKIDENTLLPCSTAGIKAHVISPVKPIIDKNGNYILNQYSSSGSIAPENSRKIITVSYSRQFVWVFLIGINIFLCVVALFVFFLLIRRSLKTIYIEYILGSLFISMCLGLNSGYFTGSPVIEPVITSTIELTDQLKPFAEKSIVDTVRFINFVTTTLAVMTAFTLSAILFRRPSRGVRKQQRLLEQVDDLRLILYVATILLIVGILRMSAVLNWASAFLPQPTANAPTEIDNFFSTFTLVIGTSYTILLASIYLSSYYILKNRAVRLVRRQVPAKEEDEKKFGKFEAEFFKFSIIDSLPRIFAIAAPFLTGTVVENLVKGLSNNSG